MGTVSGDVAVSSPPAPSSPSRSSSRRAPSATGAKRAGAAARPRRQRARAPVYVTAPAGSRGVLYVVEQGGLVRVVKAGKLQPQPFLDVRSLVRRGRRAGTARARIRARLRDEPAVRRRLHRSERRHARRSLPLERHEGVAGERDPAALRRPAVREPQRRHGRVRQGRPPLRRDGRRRLGRRPRESGAEPRARCSGRSSASTRPDPGAKPVIVADRRQQPVALLVRPAKRRPLDRRRRPELDRGGRSRRLAVARAPQLRLERLRGQLDVRGRAARPGTAREAVAQYSHDARLLDHRRLRLPRHGGAGGRRALLLRRLLQRHGLVAEARRRHWPSGSGEEPFTVKSLTSFGEDGAGELYAVSGEGTIYRLAVVTPAGAQRRHARTPTVTPTVSMTTSYQAAWRPRTKCWWISSEVA